MPSTLLIATSGNGNASDLEAVATLAAAGYDTSWQKASASIAAGDLTACTGLVVTYSAATSPLVALGATDLARPLFTLSRAATWVQHLNIATAGSQAGGVGRVNVLAAGATLFGGVTGLRSILGEVGTIQFVRGVPASATRYAQPGTDGAETTHFAVASGAAINNGATAAAARGYAVWFSDADVANLLQTGRDFTQAVAGVVLGDPSLHVTAGAMLLDHNFAGVSGSPFTSDAVFAHIAGNKPSIVRSSFSKGLRFDGGAQSIVEHVYDPAPGPGVINHDQVWMLNAPVTTTCRVWQARAGVDPGPAYHFTSDNRLQLIRADGSAAGTTTATLPVGVPFRVAISTDGPTLSLRLYADDTSTSSVETLTSSTSADVALTAERMGVITTTGLGTGVTLDLFYPQSSRTVVPGPRTYVLPVDGPRALATPPATVDPWQRGVTLVGTAVQETYPIASQEWAPAPGSLVTLDPGSGPERTFTAPGDLDAQELDFTFTATDTEGMTDSTTVRVQVRPATYAVWLGGQMVALDQRLYDPADWPQSPSIPTAVSAAMTAETVGRLTWSSPASDGGSPITGWYVARDGVASDGAGAYSTVLPAVERFVDFYNLVPGDTYTLAVAAISAEGQGPSATVTLAVPDGSTPPPVETRDPELQAYASDALWNIGIAATGVIYQDYPAMRFQQPWINSGAYSMPLTTGVTSADPLATIRTTRSPFQTIQCRIPTGSPIAGGTDGHCIVVWEGISYEFFKMVRISDTEYECARMAQNDIYGDGMGPLAGVRASGFAGQTGLVRGWEVDPAHPAYTGRIDHVLAFAIDNDALLFDDKGQGQGYFTSGLTNAELTPGWIEGQSRANFGKATGYVWPASEQDYDSPYMYAGTIPMGALFAIPPDVDIEALVMPNGQPLASNAAGLMLARACQERGAVLVDRAGGGPTFATEGTVGNPSSAALADFAAALKHDGQPNSFNRRPLITVVNQLRRVMNNTEATPGGGAVGTARLAPAVPPLA